ncbi:MAG: hypothetical protein ABFC18_03095 [Rikenellaceae bacterium]
MVLRTVDFSKKYFECQGRKFYIHDTLSFVRYRELQKLILEFTFSATFVDLFKNVNMAWEYMNQLKLGEAAVTLHNIMMGIKTLEDKDPAALRMCALFMNEEGEDPTTFDEGKMREKIDCWGKELLVSPFFQFAANLVPDWIVAYRKGFHDGSGEEAEKEK